MSEQVKKCYRWITRSFCVDEQGRVNYKKFIQFYSATFLCMVIVVFGWFVIYGKSLIWAGWDELDGIAQHYNALIYFGRWMRTIFLQLVQEHTFNIPAWDFSIGYGGDILTTLHYYVIGDPLDLLAVITPTQWMESLYCLLIILRIYLAGLAFAAYCFVRKKKPSAVFAGTFSYVFCGYVLFAAVRHPFFTNPMIYFPLMLIGVERILEKKKPKLFIFMVFLSAISNFYFFYMIVLMTIAYAVFRMWQVYHRQLLQMLRAALVMIGCGLLGILMSGIVFLPVVIAFMGDARSDTNLAIDALYGFEYYADFLSAMLSNYSPGSWTYLGYTPIVLLALFQLFLGNTKKERRDNGCLRVAFIICTLMLLIPYAGHIMNGFSYVSNRFVWGYTFLLSFILTTVWPKITSAGKKRIHGYFVCYMVYLVLSVLLVQFNDVNAFVNQFLFFFTIVCIGYVHVKPGTRSKQRRLSSLVLFGVLLLSVAVNAMFRYSNIGAYYCDEFKDAGQALEDLYNTEDSSVKKAEEFDKRQNGEDSDLTAFYRFSDTFESHNNATLISGINSTQFYWSMGNGYINQFFREMEECNNTNCMYYSNDDRAFLGALAGVRYYVAKDISGDTIPYGNSFLGTFTEKAEVSYFQKENTIPVYSGFFCIYKNALQLPLGYTYDSYLTRTQYDELPAIKKQEALLQSCLLEEDGVEAITAKQDVESSAVKKDAESNTVKKDAESNTVKKDADSITEGTPQYTDENLDYNLQCDQQVFYYDHTFYVKSPSASVTLFFDGKPGRETYLSLQDLSYRGFEKEDVAVMENLPTDAVATGCDGNSMRLYILEQLGQLVDFRDSITELKLLISNGDVEKELAYKTNRSTQYTGRDDFLVQMGYTEGHKYHITITFPNSGVYKISDLQVIEQSMSALPTYVEHLSEESLNNIDIDTNRIAADISVTSDKILCLSIPYSKGWTAYVDGEKTTLLRANTMYMALPLQKGNHEIRLVYQTPGLWLGIGCSVIGWIGFALLCLRKKLDNSERKKLPLSKQKPKFKYRSLFG